ncbi:MAG: hypothetical protein ACSLFP_00055, partial [Acidimicrobiales bacterium]
MPAHLVPQRSRSRNVGALFVALGVGLLVFAVAGDDPRTELVQPSVQLQSSTTTSPPPTVAGVQVTAVPPAPPASAATFTIPDDGPAPTSGPTAPGS